MEHDSSDAAGRLSDAFTRYAPGLLRRCTQQLSSRQDAEEVLQETFIRAWEYMMSGKKVESMGTFLYRIADNLVIDAARRRARRPEVSLDALQEEGFDIGTECLDETHQKLEVWKILQSVEKKHGTDHLLLRYLRGDTPKDIAAATGMKRGTVAVHLHRVIKKMSAAVRNLKNIVTLW